MSREDLRQLIHAGMCAWALTFPWIGKAGAIALGGVAVLFNVLVFPRLPVGRALARPEERRWTGVQWYPVAVLGLVLLLPLELAAGAWGVLAAGDAASNLVGRRLGRRNPLPWNRSKSWAGVGGFLVAAVPVSWLLMVWLESVRPEGARFAAPPSIAILALAGSAAGALAETIPWRIDDNLTVAAAAAATLFLVTHALLAFGSAASH